MYASPEHLRMLKHPASWRIPPGVHFPHHSGVPVPCIVKLLTRTVFFLALFLSLPPSHSSSPISPQPGFHSCHAFEAILPGVNNGLHVAWANRQPSNPQLTQPLSSVWCYGHHLYSITWHWWNISLVFLFFGYALVLFEDHLLSMIFKWCSCVFFFFLRQSICSVICHWCILSYTISTAHFAVHFVILADSLPFHENVV